ncbi:MAG: hypothetical protein CL717_00055, partial [Chloroflexi bacterium]|nr:hypothetical protein [Chloroflexota bacterium]
MNNEIGRKLTSLTLMTIMLAGGMTIAAPSMMPQAAAAGALYVSAENAEYDNTFGGFQIVEIIVRDNQDEVDEAQAEPVVRVNSNIIRMAQGNDGNWYAYVGNNASISAGDTANNNLNFGTQAAVTGVTFSSGVLNTYHTVAAGVIGGAPTLSGYNDTFVNNDGTSDIGQIDINTESQWPFIQGLDFTMDNFDIILEQAGADEVVTLDWEEGDMDEYAGISFDRT